MSSKVAKSQQRPLVHFKNPEQQRDAPTDFPSKPSHKRGGWRVRRRKDKSMRRHAGEKRRRLDAKRRINDGKECNKVGTNFGMTEWGA